jgi:hypothetical protein
LNYFKAKYQQNHPLKRKKRREERKVKKSYNRNISIIKYSSAEKKEGEKRGKKRKKREKRKEILLTP